MERCLHCFFVKYPGGLHAVAANKRSVMTLFSSATDLYSHQVRIVLAEKGVSVEVELVDEMNIPAELAELNPYKTVPTLVDRELALYDSRSLWNILMSVSLIHHLCLFTQLHVVIAD